MTTQPQSNPTTINFAFPFRAKDGKEIVDEHIVHEWLLGESHGPFAVTGSGMWHGGIHLSAANTGRHLDLEHGVRCIADGDIVAYRANFAPKESKIDAANGKPAAIGHYSSAFTLVRHVLEFPAANKLTFFSLYMHLRSASEYANRNKEAPPYWSRCYVVSDHAIDKPRGAGNHSPIPIDHTGLNIHATAHGIATNVLGILPRGTKIRIGTTSSDGKWGQISAIEEGRIVAPEVNGYVRPSAETGWVFLGKEKHHQLLVPDVSQAQCDQTICPSRPIRINAGELIGHLGQYWLPDSPQTSNLMTHLEVFCGEELESFLRVSQDASKDLDVKQCSLLHIGKGVKLFQNKQSVNGKDVYEEGANAPETGVFQVYSQAVLDALPAENKGPKDDLNGGQEPWWKITSANSRLEDITGWVRNRQMPHNGNVTRESPHAWCDFAPITGADAGNPTVFQSVDDWLDHMLCEDKPATGDVGKLKQVACSFYRTLSPARNEARAADELRSVSQKKWLAFRASRLIPKHKSEWAKDGSFDNFFEKVKARLESDPYHDAEIARAHELMWWDDVGKNITGTFPASTAVFHIHPIALVANFLTSHGARENDFTEADAKEALKYILAKYGRGIAETVERMYRTETRHFQSMQYRRCGTGGMEVHGVAPFYGWTSDFYSEEPTGTWSAYEGVGLSQMGGNQQITSRKKEFVVVSSVAVGMEFKARYIVHYGGNYARWFSRSPDEQAVYRHTIESITPKIVNSLP
ncbi:hypothetical protein [Pandoraea communis]|uniref:hypothetical protein n=1 Tax=Pandoraea communis TaxID=2508297 RepID=UPI0025A64988|nr:hypothetical protein [Pandoraea communis]MDM8359314.1 hypothetical protein [Pandoraea communis]